MIERKTIKCRFCKWQVAVSQISKKGERESNYHKLLFHVSLEHPAEVEAVEKFLKRTIGSD